MNAARAHTLFDNRTSLFYKNENKCIHKPVKIQTAKHTNPLQKQYVMQSNSPDPKEHKRFLLSPGVLFLLFSAWGAAILYFFLRGTPYLSSTLHYGIDIFHFILIAASIYGSGLATYRLLKIECASKAEETAYCCAFGIGIISLLVLAIGSAGLLYKQAAYILIVVISCTCLPIVLKHWKSHPAKREAPLAGFDAWCEKGLYAVLFFLAAYSCIAALAPTIDYDTMLYHYGLPNIFKQMHAVRYLPENVYSGFPFTIEMLFTLGALVGGFEVASLITWGISLVYLMAVYGFSKRYFNHMAALLAATILLSTPLVACTFFRPAADMGLALFISLGFFSLIIWRDEKKHGWLVAAAVLTGLALSTKYTALFFGLGVLNIVLIFQLLRERSTAKHIAASLCIFTGIAVLVVSPWYLKNWLTTGNPFFPAFFNLFGGSDYSAAMAARHLQDALHPGSLSLKDFFVVPVQMLGSASHFGYAVGPFAFVIWPLLAVIKKRHPKTFVLILFVFLTFCLWLVSFRLSRFMISFFGMTAILGGYVFEQFRQSRFVYLRSVTVFFIGLCLALNSVLFLSYTRIIFDPIPVVFGAVSKSDYLKKHLSIFSNNWFYEYKDLYRNPRIPPAMTGNVYGVIEFANQNLSSSDKILFLGETIHAYLEKPYICNSAFNRNMLVELLKSGSADSAKEQLIRDGITHILFNPSELKRLAVQKYSYTMDRRTLAELKVFLQKNTTVTFQEGNVLLLQLVTTKDTTGDTR